MTTPDQQPQQHTWADIQAAVADGRITEAQGQLAWAEQVAKMASDQATQRAEAQVQLKAVETEIERYTEALPDVAKDDTPERGRVKAEFARLRKLGFPDALQTELAALQAVFGPVTALSKKRDADPEPQDDVGGGSPAPKGKANGATEGPPPSFSADEKRFYEHLIRQGVVKSWAAAAELVDSHGNKRLRSKHA